ncbi:MAG TPA: glycosyltransferase [Bacilli bacterium]
MKLSVCMIVRDEEQNIIRSLSSIPAHYEKIIVDTGSKDRTVYMAKSLGAIVYEYKWENDFAKARNVSIGHAKGDYLLIMDADEELEVAADRKLQSFINRFPEMPGTATLFNIIGEDIHNSRMIRFFPNLPQYRFSGAIHETLTCNGQPVSFRDTELIIRHFGYDPQVYAAKNKQERYRRLYETHLQTYPDDGYMLYQLGKLLFSTKQFAEALEPLQKSVNLHEADRLYFPPLLVLTGYTLKELGASREAEQLLQSYERQYPDFPDLPFLLGLLAMDTGRIERIAPCFLKALAIGETAKYSTVQGVGSFKAAYNLGVYYEITGNRANARKYYGLAGEYGYKPALERLAKLLI